MVISTAAVLSAALLGALYASRASSQARSLDVSVYTPIGVIQSPNGAHTIPWVLDATNRRVVMYKQELTELTASKIESRTGNLPNP